MSKKRLLSVLLVLAMCFSMLPTWAMAAAAAIPVDTEGAPAEDAPTVTIDATTGEITATPYTSGDKVNLYLIKASSATAILGRIQTATADTALTDIETSNSTNTQLGTDGTDYVKLDETPRALNNIDRGLSLLALETYVKNTDGLTYAKSAKWIELSSANVKNTTPTPLAAVTITSGSANAGTITPVHVLSGTPATKYYVTALSQIPGTIATDRAEAYVKSEDGLNSTTDNSNAQGLNIAANVGKYIVGVEYAADGSVASISTPAAVNVDNVSEFSQALGTPTAAENTSGGEATAGSLTVKSNKAPQNPVTTIADTGLVASSVTTSTLDGQAGLWAGYTVTVPTTAYPTIAKVAVSDAATASTGLADTVTATNAETVKSTFTVLVNAYDGEHQYVAAKFYDANDVQVGETMLFDLTLSGAKTVTLKEWTFDDTGAALDDVAEFTTNSGATISYYNISKDANVDPIADYVPGWTTDSTSSTVTGIEGVEAAADKDTAAAAATETGDRVWAVNYASGGGILRVAEATKGTAALKSVTTSISNGAISVTKDGSEETDVVVLYLAPSATTDDAYAKLTTADTKTKLEGTGGLFADATQIAKTTNQGTPTDGYYLTAAQEVAANKLYVLQYNASGALLAKSAADSITASDLANTVTVEHAGTEVAEKVKLTAATTLGSAAEGIYYKAFDEEQTLENVTYDASDNNWKAFTSAAEVTGIANGRYVVVAIVDNFGAIIKSAQGGPTNDGMIKKALDNTEIAFDDDLADDMGLTLDLSSFGYVDNTGNVSTASTYFYLLDSAAPEALAKLSSETTFTQAQTLLGTPYDKDTFVAKWSADYNKYLYAIEFTGSTAIKAHIDTPIALKGKFDAAQTVRDTPAPDVPDPVQLEPDSNLAFTVYADGSVALPNTTSGTDYLVAYLGTAAAFETDSLVEDAEKAGTGGLEGSGGVFDGITARTLTLDVDGGDATVTHNSIAKDAGNGIANTDNGKYLLIAKYGGDSGSKQDTDKLIGFYQAMIPTGKVTATKTAITLTATSGALDNGGGLSTDTDASAAEYYIVDALPSAEDWTDATRDSIIAASGADAAEFPITADLNGKYIIGFQCAGLLGTSKVVHYAVSGAIAVTNVNTLGTLAVTDGEIVDTGLSGKKGTVQYYLIDHSNANGSNTLSEKIDDNDVANKNEAAVMDMVTGINSNTIKDFGTGSSHLYGLDKDTMNNKLTVADIGKYILAVDYVGDPGVSVGYALAEIGAANATVLGQKGLVNLSEDLSISNKGEVTLPGKAGFSDATGTQYLYFLGTTAPATLADDITYATQRGAISGSEYTISINGADVENGKAADDYDESAVAAQKGKYLLMVEFDGTTDTSKAIAYATALIPADANENAPDILTGYHIELDKDGNYTITNGTTPLTASTLTAGQTKYYLYDGSDDASTLEAGFQALSTTATQAKTVGATYGGLADDAAIDQHADTIADALDDASPYAALGKKIVFAVYAKQSTDLANTDTITKIGVAEVTVAAAQKRTVTIAETSGGASENQVALKLDDVTNGIDYYYKLTGTTVDTSTISMTDSFNSEGWTLILSSELADATTNGITVPATAPEESIAGNYIEVVGVKGGKIVEAGISTKKTNEYLEGTSTDTTLATILGKTVGSGFSFSGTAGNPNADGTYTLDALSPDAVAALAGGVTFSSDTVIATDGNDKVTLSFYESTDTSLETAKESITLTTSGSVFVKVVTNGDKTAVYAIAATITAEAKGNLSDDSSTINYGDKTFSVALTTTGSFQENPAKVAGNWTVKFTPADGEETALKVTGATYVDNTHMTLTVSTEGTNYEGGGIVNGALDVVAARYVFSSPSVNVDTTSLTTPITIAVPTNAISVTADNGEVVITVDGSSAQTLTTGDSVAAVELGKTFTITASDDTADKGYKFDSLTVKDAENHDVVPVEGVYTMPNSTVTVTATFVEDGEQTDAEGDEIISVALEGSATSKVASLTDEETKNAVAADIAAAAAAIADPNDTEAEPIDYNIDATSLKKSDAAQVETSRVDLSSDITTLLSNDAVNSVVLDTDAGQITFDSATLEKMAGQEVSITVKKTTAERVAEAQENVADENAEHIKAIYTVEVTNVTWEDGASALELGFACPVALGKDKSELIVGFIDDEEMIVSVDDFDIAADGTLTIYTSHLTEFVVLFADDVENAEEYGELRFADVTEVTGGAWKSFTVTFGGDTTNAVFLQQKQQTVNDTTVTVYTPYYLNGARTMKVSYNGGAEVFSGILFDNEPDMEGFATSGEHGVNAKDEIISINGTTVECLFYGND